MGISTKVSSTDAGNAVSTLRCAAAGPAQTRFALRPWHLAVVAFAALWVDLIHQLSYVWRANEQYSYGWFVPVLAAGLFLRKWPSRPCAHPGVPARWISILVILTALMLLPIRVVHEINQDWPLIGWSLALGMISISLYALFVGGGKRWLSHFAFPACLILAAVQWPYRVEHPLTQKMMRVVAGVSVEALGWLNIPAVHRGNLIELTTGVVGVDEACSGIRSLQSTVMASLFLGELYRFVWPFRILLLGIGIFLAFVLNVVRSLFLACQAASGGANAVDKWHDSAGLAIVVLCFACLCLVALLLNAKSKGQGTKPELPLRDLNKMRAPHPDTMSRPAPSPLPFALGPSPTAFAYALTAWAALLLIGNEAWYRVHEIGRPESLRWWVSFPTNSPSFQQVPVSDFSRRLLKYDQASTGSWTEPDGTQWSAYCFRWRAGDPTARMAALGHRPEYCMTGSGHHLAADLGIKSMPVSGLRLPFRAYTFDSSERPLHVFFCLWEDGAEKQFGFSRSKFVDRLRSTFLGRRGLGQQTLEVVCSGYTGVDEAEQAVGNRLASLIQVEIPNQNTPLLSRAP